MHVNDFLTYIQNSEDKPFLRTCLLDVNMRLFFSSTRYRAIIGALCDYIRDVALMDLQGYQRPFGMSGANLALPFNIVGMVQERGTDKARCEILLNPQIKEYMGPLEYSRSNCGSIRLEEPIEVLRYYAVRVNYYDEEGQRFEKWFGRGQGSYTLQHEIDHNLGILITDHGRILDEADKPTRPSLQAHSALGQKSA